MRINATIHNHNTSDTFVVDDSIQTIMDNRFDFESFFYHSPVASAKINENGIIIIYNQAFLKLFEIKSKEEIQSFNFFHNKLRELTYPFLLKHITKHSIETVWRIGRKGLFLVENYDITNYNGDVIYNVIIENNSAIKKSERHRLITEEKYRNIIDQIPVGIYRTIINGEIIFANKYLANLLGYKSIEEVIGLSSQSFFIYPDECKFFYQDLIVKQKTEYATEYLLRKKDNSQIWVKDSGRIFYDTSKEVLFFDGVLEEITFQKNAEMELNRLVAAINQISEAILITDTQGVIQFANPTFEKMTMFSCREVIGKRLDLILKGDNFKELFYRITKSLLAGKIWSGTTLSRRKDDSLYHEHLVISPLKNNDNEIVNFIIVKRDITQELKLEEQLRQSQKLQAIGTLAGGIAHDFNNILMGMQIYTEILLKKIPAASNEHDILRKILTAETRAKDLIKQILTFSRITDNGQEKLQIHIIIKEDLKLIESTFPSMLKIDAKISDCGYIMGNPAQMHQILMNLCTNANHAMDGVGILTVSLNRSNHIKHTDGRTEFTGNDWICLKVSDTGCGIENKIAERIFEPFFTTKAVGKGTGLGLASVHGIVEQYKGKIYFNTEIGQGTSFYIYLPAL